VNCAEIIQDIPGQPAYQMFGIKRRFQRCKVWPPRFNESSVRVHQIWVPPSKRVISATVDYSCTRTVAGIDTDLLRIITSTADELPGVLTSMTLNDLEPPKIWVLVNFSLF